MTFLEAAIQLLEQAGRPLHFKELTEKAVRQGLLEHVGRTPELTMQARLAQETKRGNASRVVRVKPGVFGLRSYERRGAERRAGNAQAAAERSRPAAPAPANGAAAVAEDLGGKRRRRRRGRGHGRQESAAAPGAAPTEAPGPEAAPVEAPPSPAEQPEAGTPEEALAAEQLAAEVEQEAVVAEPVEAAPESPPPAEAEAPAPDETALEALAREYADEIGAAVAPPMLDEIQADRGRDRRRRGRDRGRDRKDKGKRAREAPPPREEQPRPAAVQPVAARPAAATARAPAPAPAAAPRAAEAPSGATRLADVAVQLLTSLDDPRPVHARQLAAMAIKRRLVGGEVEALWRDIQLALLEDSRARQAQGFRPRVRSHGASLFALQNARLDEELVRAEEELARRATLLAEETHRALRRRLARLPSAAMERLVRLWLERTGATDLERAKQIDATVYIVARQDRGGIARRVLVAVHAGDAEIDRRAVGEARAGVVAKQLDEAVVIGASRLSAEGEKEARKQGPPVHVLDGAGFAAALIAAGVGAVRAWLPIAYLDVDLLAELGESP